MHHQGTGLRQQEAVAGAFASDLLQCRSVSASIDDRRILHFEAIHDELVTPLAQALGPRGCPVAVALQYLNNPKTPGLGALSQLPDHWLGVLIISVLIISQASFAHDNDERNLGSWCSEQHCLLVFRRCVVSPLHLAASSSARSAGDCHQRQTLLYGAVAPSAPPADLP